MSGEEMAAFLRKCVTASNGVDLRDASVLTQAADLIERQAEALMEVSKAGHLFKAHDIARAVLREG
jgi:hypothetical protein